MKPEVEELLDLLIENEREIARYYHALIDFIPAHAETWRFLRAEENAHADALLRVRANVTSSPELFRVGKYDPRTVSVMIRDVRGVIEEIQRREVTPQFAVSFIAGIEDSYLESRLEDAINTNVIEVRSILQQLADETRLHRDLVRRITA